MVEAPCSAHEYVLYLSSPGLVSTVEVQKVVAVLNYVKAKYRVSVVTEGGEEEALRSACPHGKGVYLGTPCGSVLCQSRAIVMFVGKCFPYYGLCGEGGLLERAHTEGWLDFSCSWLDVPANFLCSKENENLAGAAKKDVLRALDVIEGYLLRNTYLSSDLLTLADICVAASVREAVAKGGMEGELKGRTSLYRWYNTIFNNADVSFDAPGHASSSSSSSSSSCEEERAEFVETPPKVSTSIYKRSRVRVREIFHPSKIDSLVGSKVTVCGWARTIRNANAGKLLFVELNDGSCSSSIQCVLQDTTPGFADCKANASGGTGASFMFIGDLVQSQGSGQSVEIQVTKGECLGPVYGGEGEGMKVGGANYPLSKKGHTLEHLRTHAHLRARAKVHAAAMRIRHAMSFATHKFFNDLGFLYIHTPIVTCADCEGAGEQFGITTMLGTDARNTSVKLEYVQEEKKEGGGEEDGNSAGTQKKELSNKAKKKAAKKAAALAKEAAKAAAKGGKPPEEKLPVGAVDYGKDFFGKRANLTVSGQLNVETHCCALSDVYTFGPTFRAENSHTSRHLAEFWMIEPEIAFAELSDDMNLAEDYIKYCVNYALKCCSEDLEFFQNGYPQAEEGLIDRLKNVVEAPFKVRGAR